MLSSFKKSLLVSLIGMVVAGCGGGGGGGSSSPAEPPVAGPLPNRLAEPVFNISGIIQIPPATLVDLDTADPSTHTSGQRNDSFDTAQVILNPSVVGGYLSRSEGTYGAGAAFRFSMDKADIFKTTLLQGQSVRLEVFDADVRYQQNPDGNLRAVNLDSHSPTVTMQLFRVSDRMPVGALVSLNTAGDASASAVLTVPATDEYFIQLQEAAGPTTYVLTVGQVQGASYHISAADEFVPGEAIVAFEPGYQAQVSRSMNSSFSALSGDAGRGQRIRFRFGPAPSASRAASSTPMSLAEQKRMTLAEIEKLRQQPGVRYAEPNFLRESYLKPADPLYPRQWHYPLINLPQAWDLSQNRGANVVVAVLDTGVLPSHPDLAGQFVDGYDFISSPASALDGDGYDADPTDPGDKESGNSSYHGTHVAGTIGALANNRGGVGVAFGAKVMPVRVLGKDGKGTDADIAEAIRYAAGLPNASGRLPSSRADIINLSLGAHSPSTVLRLAVEAARAAGVIVVAAAGNSNSSFPHYPAGFDGVISVSAVGPDKKLAPYSNFGTTIDVAAPGGNFKLDLDGNGLPDGVVSTWGDDSVSKPARHAYSMMEGTSMAAPHVAGVIALMKSVDPGLTPAQVDQYLYSGHLTQDIGSASLYGRGMIDAAKAVSTALNSQPQALLVSSAASLQFDTLSTTMQLTLSNGGSGSLSIQAPMVTLNGGNWLSITAESVDSSTGLGTYRVSVDATGLSPEVTYSGTIQVDSNQNDISIPVLLQLPDTKRLANAGRHYLLLLDPALPQTDNLVDALVLDADSGAYRYAFENVKPGGYWLVAGSDLDNDGTICDPGEACAIYPVRYPPETVVVSDQNLAGYDFNTGFATSFGLQRNADKAVVDQSFVLPERLKQ